ncbi:serine hydrolase [Paenibacillus sp. 5J-6]|uniref:Serine hydrolase n=1 Tax=Paenibacillus silvestris TaxID=2606219 RepID=A0A6L8US98_9BACL|nr:serine hydrolase domain-containing protein [Paenibacillus silvestris]MZQ80923.1 serine hydrolase [Paenibacillus silvestris]
MAAAFRRLGACRHLFGHQLDKLLSTLQSRDEFSGSALLSKGDAIIINQGYGYANREHQVINTTETKFRIGSITKEFIAMAILMLQEQGVLSVHENLKRFTPSPPLKYK